MPTIPLMARLVWLDNGPAKSSVLIWDAGTRASSIRYWVHWSSSPDCHTGEQGNKDPVAGITHVGVDEGHVSGMLVVAQGHDDHIATLCSYQIWLECTWGISHLRAAWLRLDHHCVQSPLDNVHLDQLLAGTTRDYGRSVPIS